MARRYKRSRKYYRPKSKNQFEWYKKIFFNVFAIILILAGLWFGGIAVLSNLDDFWGIFRSETTAVSPEKDAIAPIPPKLNYIPTATNEEAVSISGFAESESKVKLFHNGEKSGESFADEDGAFKFESVLLRNGENNFYVTATDEAGNESTKSRTVQVTFNREAPKLEIEKPENGSTFSGEEERTIEISGTVENTTDLRINGTRAVLGVDGKFTFYLTLEEEGENKIKFEASNTAGNTTEKEITVDYESDEED